MAIDWSGAVSGAERTIWLAEAADGEITRLECGRGRAAIAEFLVAEAIRTPDLVVGLDFAFSFPAWFLEERGLPYAPALWDLVAREGESWLAGCEPPFWGRPGRKKPVLPDDLRRTDRDAPAIGGIRPKSVFQIGGAGAVGTGSLRGMPVLKRLRDAGFAMWPFDAPGRPLVIEIYPRLLTGAVNKRDSLARLAYLAEHFPALSGEMLESAASCEDAFDAAVSALVMDASREELAILAELDDLQTRREGQIWAPASVLAPSNGKAAVRPAVRPAATRAHDLPTWRSLVRSMLPAPVVERGDHALVGGDPGEVVAELGPDAIRIAQYVGRGMAPGPEPVEKEVARFDPRSARPRDVARAIVRARAKRVGSFQWCTGCHEVQPPERMFDAGLCEGCAIEHLYIVF
jgi:hypothetical protein